MDLVTHLQKRCFYFRSFVIVTLLIGITLHSIGLFVDREVFIREVFTPQIDMIFAIPMTIGGLGMLLFRKRAILKNRFTRIVYYAAMILFLLSIPLHVFTFISHSTSYIRIFPPWYSLAEIPIFVIMLRVFLRLKCTTSVKKS